MRDEEARLAALHGYGVLDSARPAVLDELSALTASVFDVPAAAVSLIDRDRVWFAGHTGWGAAHAPRHSSFSGHVVGGQALVVPDAARHPVFHVHGAGPAPIRFFAGAPIIDPDGHVLGALCVADALARDFSDRQLDVLTGLAGQAARHLTALREQYELARLRRREEDLVAAISHELRTPVTIMQGYLESLADEDALTPYQGLIEPIRRNGDRLVRMVDHLLAGTSAVGAPVNGQPGHLDLAGVAEAAVGGCLAQARAGGVRIRLETAGAPPPVPGDFGRLCQVAEQVLRNAVTFSAAGDEVTVRVADGATPSIEIVDHGVGVPADELPHLPERFFRGRHAREHAVPGMGLGLNIAEQILTAHGGTLSITSPGPRRRHHGPGHGPRRLIRATRLIRARRRSGFEKHGPHRRH